jgi:hypothetical protein
VNECINLVNVYAVTMFRQYAICSREFFADLNDDNSVGVACRPVKLVNTCSCMNRQTDPTVNRWRASCGHHSWRQGFQNGLEASKVGRDVIDRCATVAQKTFGWAKESASVMNAWERKNPIQIWHESAEDMKVHKVCSVT